MTENFSAHGGPLVDLLLSPEAAQAAKEEAKDLKSWDLSHRQLCDIELLLNGGFSPLQGFLNKADYESVVDNQRLADGVLWPMPITLDVDQAFADSLSAGERIALRDKEGVIIALMTIGDVWQPDKVKEAEKVFGANDQKHPAVQYLFQEAGDWYVGGSLEGLQLPVHYDFKHLRSTPQELRSLFKERGWKNIAAFQTRNPMHRAHIELAVRAAENIGGQVVINAVVGMTKAGDIDYFTRVRCYEHVLRRFPENTGEISLLPLAMRMGGPVEALWHAIIRRNYGFTHFIVGRDHAGPGKNSQGEDFYDPYAAQEIIIKYQDELGIEMVPFQQMVFVESKDTYYPVDDVPEGEKTLNISGTEFRRRLRAGEEIPGWFSYPEVVAELRKTNPPTYMRGFTLFFTGLSGAGKSTIANAVAAKLLAGGGRQVTMLDGDLVRKHLSSELTFSKEHRDLNVERIGYVASEATRHGGIAICAPIAPYANVRDKVRAMVEQFGGFFEIHVATDISLCEERDRKGLYVKARAGLIKNFTGIDDPYEAPEQPEMRIDTASCSADEAADQVIRKLLEDGYLTEEQFELGR